MPFWEKFFKDKKDTGGFDLVGVCNHKAVFDVLLDDRVITFEGSYKKMFTKLTKFKTWVDLEE